MKTHTITKNNKVKKYDNGDEFHYDSNGNEIYHKYSNGFEVWQEYDENNNVIHYRNSKGYEYCQEYDKNNNCIHYKNSNGFEYWKEYDENNNLIHCGYSNGDKEFYINNKTVTKEEWFKYYYLNNFQYKYIYDIILTLKDNYQKINIDNIKKHLNGIEIEDLEKKYEKVLKYHKILCK